MRSMTPGQLLLLILILIFFCGSWPTWPHAQNWGYGPMGTMGFLLVIVIILILLGKL